MPNKPSSVVVDHYHRQRPASSINKLVLCSMGEMIEQDISPHYFINKNGKITKYVSTNLTASIPKDLTWGNDQDLGSSCILVAVEQNSKLFNMENNQAETTDSVKNKKSVSDLRFAQNIKEYTSKKRRLLHDQNDINTGAISRSIVKLASEYGIERDNIISDFDVKLSTAHNIITSAIWQEINPSFTSPDMLDAILTRDVKGLNIGTTNQRVKDLKSNLSIIGYKIDDETSTLDSETFDSCMSLCSKIFGRATTLEAYQSGEVSNQIIEVVRVMAQRKVSKTTLDSSYPSTVLDKNVLKYLSRKKSDEISRSIRNSENNFTPDSIAYAAIMTVITILICIILPYIPGLTLVAANIGQIVCGFVVGGAITGHFMSPHPKAGAEVSRSLSSMTDTIEKTNRTLKKLTSRLKARDVTIDDITLDTSPKKPTQKKETLLSSYISETIATLQMLAIPISILLVTVLIATLFTVPAIVVNILVSFSIITYALTGTFASYISSLSLMEKTEPQTKQLIENFKKENKFIKDLLKAKGMDIETPRMNVREKTLDAINKKYKIKKIKVAVTAFILLALVVTLMVISPLIPILTTGILDIIVRQILTTILMSVGTMLAIKEYLAIDAEKNVEIFKKLTKERKDIVFAAALSREESISEDDLRTKDKLHVYYKQTREKQKENIKTITANSKALGITLMLFSVKIFILSAIITLSTPTFALVLLSALISLVGGTLFKYGLKSILAPNSTIVNIQLDMDSAYLNHELSTNFMLTIAVDEIRRCRQNLQLNYTNSAFEQLEFEEKLILAKIRAIDKKINQLSIEKAAYQEHQKTSKILYQRLITPHTIIAALSTIVFSLAIPTIPFLALTTTMSGILTTIFIVLTVAASSAFGDSLFTYYPPKYVAARTIDIMDLNKQKEELVLNLNESLEEYRQKVNTQTESTLPDVIEVLPNVVEELEKKMHYSQKENSFTNALTNASLTPLVRETNLVTAY